MDRSAKIVRKTNETDISLELKIDGTGIFAIETGVGFFDHMLELFAKHGFFDLTVQAKGDLHVDAHHTVEDVGICLGLALKQALGNHSGLRRFGSFKIPMYEALAGVDLDLCGRPQLTYQTPIDTGKIGTFDLELVEEFFHAFANNSGTTLHINVHYGKNRHHIVEAIFKAFAKALDLASSHDDRVIGIPSTKGVL